jgi:hypothetical protein
MAVTATRHIRLAVQELSARHRCHCVGGEISAIDNAGFGTFTIPHSITITSRTSAEAGIAAPTSGSAAAINGVWRLPPKAATPIDRNWAVDGHNTPFLRRLGEQ